MPPSPAVRCTAAWFVAAALGALVALPVAGTSQTLVGTTLRPIEDGEALVTNLIDMLAGGGRAATRATFGRVVVTEDGERRLVVTVSYNGLPNLRLEGDVSGRDRRRQAQIQAQPVAPWARRRSPSSCSRPHRQAQLSNLRTFA